MHKTYTGPSLVRALAPVLWSLGCSETDAGTTPTQDAATVLADVATEPSPENDAGVPDSDEAEDTAQDAQALDDASSDMGPVVVTGLETVPSTSMFIETEPGNSLPVAVTVHPTPTARSLMFRMMFCGRPVTRKSST